MAKFEGPLYLFGGITARISIITASSAMLRNDLTKSCHDILCLQSTTDHFVYWWRLSRPIATKGPAPNKISTWHIRSTRSATVWHTSKRFGFCPFRALGWEKERDQAFGMLRCFVLGAQDSAMSGNSAALHFAPIVFCVAFGPVATGITVSARYIN